MILTLHSVKLEAPLDVTGESLVLTELVLPRNAIARKAALKEIQLTRGKRSFARSPFYETGLLKEKVDGVFGVKVSVTRPMRQRAFGRFLRQLLATGVESAVDWLPGALALPGGASILEDLADEAADAVADSLTDADPVFIAAGGIDLDSEELSAGHLSIPLKLTARIRKSTTPPGPRARDGRRRSVETYRKGQSVGEIKLNLVG